MIIIFAKELDFFVKNVIDWLDGIPYMIISTNSGLITKSSEIIDEKRPLVSLSNQYTLGCSSLDINSIWFNGGITTNPEQNLWEQLIQKSLIEGFFAKSEAKTIGDLKNNYSTNKIQNLLSAKSVGFKVPETIVTTSKIQLVKFFENNIDTGIICKRLSETYYVEWEEVVYDISKTIEVTKESLENLPDSFGLSMFQKKINKEYEIRVVYINDEIYCAAIFDQSIDYRRNFRTKNKPRIVPYRLNKEIELRIRKLIDTLQFSYVSIDLIKSPDDYFFLEINPVGQISFINNACNYFLDKKIAQFLKSKSN